MTTLKEAAQQALEAIESDTVLFSAWTGKMIAARTALRATLAEPQEPGFWGRVAARQASRIKQLETAAQQALEAFRMCVPMDGRHAEVDAAFRNLRAALAEPVQEPVKQCMAHGECFGGECIYTSPPQRPAEPVQEPDPWGAGYEAGYAAGVAELLAEPVQEPVAWGCFKDGELQSELVGTKTDVDFWVASDEPHMQGMVAGPLYAAPPQRPAEPDTDCHAQGICQRSGYSVGQKAEPVQEPDPWGAGYEAGYQAGMAERPAEHDTDCHAQGICQRTGYSIK